MDQKNAQKDLEYLKTLFETGHLSLRKKTDGVYRYTSDSFKGVVSIIKYLDANPLKTVKRESFKKWKKVYYMTIVKEHITTNGLSKIQKIKKGIDVAFAEFKKKTFYSMKKESI